MRSRRARRRMRVKTCSLAGSLLDRSRSGLNERKRGDEGGEERESHGQVNL